MRSRYVRTAAARSDAQGSTEPALLSARRIVAIVARLRIVLAEQAVSATP
jgi:hypothetical protein